jgi:hypothetical protein
MQVAVVSAVEVEDLRRVCFEAVAVVVEEAEVVEALLIADVVGAAAVVEMAVVLAAAAAAVVSVAETAASAVELEELYELLPLLLPAAADGVAVLAEVEAAAEPPLSEPASPFPSLRGFWWERLDRESVLVHHEPPSSHYLPRH